jgi:dephospho-CoA kinase
MQVEGPYCRHQLVDLAGKVQQNKLRMMKLHQKIFEQEKRFDWATKLLLRMMKLHQKIFEQEKRFDWATKLLLHKQLQDWMSKLYQKILKRETRFDRMMEAPVPKLLWRLEQARKPSGPERADGQGRKQSRGLVWFGSIDGAVFSSPFPKG